jgi:hypothetical protein
MPYDHIHRLRVRHSPGDEPGLLGRCIARPRPGDGPAPRSVAVDAPPPISEAQVVTSAPSVVPARFPLLTDVRSRLRHRRGMPSPVAI